MTVATSKQQGLDQIKHLVDQFRDHLIYYKSGEFDETSTRQTFVDHLFEALGWDVSDTAGLGPHRDVILEHRASRGIQLAGEDDWDADLPLEETAARTPRASVPDYVFRIDGRTRFLAEAKKPSVNLRWRAPAFQIKSYTWSLGNRIAVLTSFDEFRVFDCTLRPEYDKPGVGALPEYELRFNEYEAHWDILWDSFSREAVASGSLDRLSGVTRRRTKGAVAVDEAFLQELDQWRAELASDLADRNNDLDGHELAQATQRILDRLIFIRVCEDRQIEPTIILRRYARTTDSYQKAVANEFRRLDLTYNGQLFAHHFSERLQVGDDLFQRLVERLYFPFSPYRFDVIGADLLGTIYERFLGREIQLRADSTVAVVDKPEIRHAGGIYYTPTWVVNLIVAKTLEPLVTGKAPRAVANLKILDPACGSGAFLLSAFDFLVRWHENYFDQNPEAQKEKHFADNRGKTHLTSDAKAEILSNNIFGVDIDPQAVEVTQMSLYLKLLEHESRGSLVTQHRLFESGFLPKLDRNIRCGNSLLEGTDIDQSLLFDRELRWRINPFNWRDSSLGFGEVFKSRGGFDAVIGNPPYTKLQTLREYRPHEAEIYEGKFEAATEGSFDISGLFVEQGLKLLRSGRSSAGRLGFIISRQFIEADYGAPLRKNLAEGRHTEEIVDFGSGLVFKGVGIYTLILISTTARRKSFRLTRVPPPPSLEAFERSTVSGSPVSEEVDSELLTAKEWDLLLGAERNLITRLGEEHPSLGQVAKGTIFQGVVTGADYVFRLQDCGRSSEHPDCRLVQRRDSAAPHSPIEEALLRPVLAGRSDIGRFAVAPATDVLLLPYWRQDASSQYSLIPNNRLRGEFPHAFAWLERNEEKLRSRRSGKWTDYNWYAFSRRQNLELFEEQKILIPYMVEELCAAYDRGGHFFVNVSTGGYGIPEAELSCPAPYLVALLSSRLLSWLLRLRSRTWRGGWFAARKRNLERLPIPNATESEAKELARLYDQCVDWKREISGAKSASGRELAERAFASAVESLDRSVEEVFCLAASERALIREVR